MHALRLFFRSHGLVALALILTTLAMRALIPAGWMPNAQGTGITLCSEGRMVSAWIDSEGVLHKEAPAKAQGPCVFAAMAFAATGPVAVASASLLWFQQVRPLVPAQTITIGHGLAAPPPPKTGPPVLN